MRGTRKAGVEAGLADVRASRSHSRCSGLALPMDRRTGVTLLIVTLKH